MPHIKDLSQNVLWEGNEGEKWIVDSSVNSPNTINVKLKRLEVKEILEPIKEE